MVLRGVGTGGQLALHGRLGQPGGFAAHGLDGAHRFVQRQQHLPHFIAGRGVNLHIEVARSNFFGNLHGLTHGAGDGARDPPTQQHGQQYRHARQAQQQGLRRRNDRSRAFARLFHQLGLVAHQRSNGVEVGGLLGAQTAHQVAAEFLIRGALLNQADGHILLRPVSGAHSHDGAQLFLACIGADAGLQLLQQAINDPALLVNGVQRTLFLCGIRDDVGIAQLACNEVDGARQFVGHHHLGKLVVHHVLHFVAQGGKAGVADDGNDHHQQQSHGEADTQADADFEVVHFLFLWGCK